MTDKRRKRKASAKIAQLPRKRYHAIQEIETEINEIGNINLIKYLDDFKNYIQNSTTFDSNIKKLFDFEINEILGKDQCVSLSLCNQFKSVKPENLTKHLDRFNRKYFFNFDSKKYQLYPQNFLLWIACRLPYTCLIYKNIQHINKFDTFKKLTGSEKSAYGSVMKGRIHYSDSFTDLYNLYDTENDSIVFKFIKQVHRNFDTKSHRDEYLANLSISAFHELFVGMFAVNNIRMQIPNLVFTYGFVMGNDVSPSRNTDFFQNYPVVLVETVNNSSSFKKALIGLETDDLISLFSQILCTLEMLYIEYKFVHLDLHTDNILIQPIQTNSTAFLRYSDKYVQVHNTLARIFDFGFSRVIIKDTTLGFQENYLDTRYKYVDFMFDVWKLLSFCLCGLYDQNLPSAQKKQLIVSQILIKLANHMKKRSVLTNTKLYIDIMMINANYNEDLSFDQNRSHLLKFCSSIQAEKYLRILLNSKKPNTLENIILKTLHENEVGAYLLTDYYGLPIFSFWLKLYKHLGRRKPGVSITEYQNLRLDLLSTLPVYFDEKDIWDLSAQTLELNVNLFVKESNQDIQKVFTCYNDVLNCLLDGDDEIAMLFNKSIFKILPKDSIVLNS